MGIMGTVRAVWTCHLDLADCYWVGEIAWPTPAFYTSSCETLFNLPFIVHIHNSSILNNMRSSFVVALATAGIAAAEGLLGLPRETAEMLSSLKPAADNDPRFTNFKAAGSGDGMLYHSLLLTHTDHIEQFDHHARA